MRLRICRLALCYWIVRISRARWLGWLSRVAFRVCGFVKLGIVVNGRLSSVRGVQGLPPLSPFSSLAGSPAPFVEARFYKMNIRSIGAWLDQGHIP